MSPPPLETETVGAGPPPPSAWGALPVTLRSRGIISDDDGTRLRILMCDTSAGI